MTVEISRSDTTGPFHLTLTVQNDEGVWETVKCFDRKDKWKVMKTRKFLWWSWDVTEWVLLETRKDFIDRCIKKMHELRGARPAELTEWICPRDPHSKVWFYAE